MYSGANYQFESLGSTPKLVGDPKMLPVNNTLPNPNKSTLTEKIRFINRDKNLSKGAKLLAIEIIIASNSRSYCWHSIEAFCAMISAGESQVHLYLNELQNIGYVVVVHRLGRTNRYYLGKKLHHKPPKIEPAGGVRNSGPKKEILNTKKENVPTENVIPFSSQENNPTSSTDVHYPPDSTYLSNTTINQGSIQKSELIKSAPPDLNPHPALKPRKHPHLITEKISNQITKNPIFNLDLVLEIEKITGDRKSRACWIKIVKSVSPNLIFVAMSSLKTAIHEGIVANPGAYFVGVIKNLTDIFSTEKKCSVVDFPKAELVIVGPRTNRDQSLKPITPAGPEIVTQSLSEIRRILNRPRMELGLLKLSTSKN